MAGDVVEFVSLDSSPSHSCSEEDPVVDFPSPLPVGKICGIFNKWSCSIKTHYPSGGEVETKIRGRSFFFAMWGDICTRIKLHSRVLHRRQNFCSHVKYVHLERIQLWLQQCCCPDIIKAFPGVELSLMGLVIGRNQNVSKNLRVSHHHIRHTHHTPMLRNTGCCLFAIGNIWKNSFGVLGVWPALCPFC
jgi:hypothetical protein